MHNLIPYCSRVHFRDGRPPLDVYTDPQTTTRLVWGTEPGDDAHDMGYAALQNLDGVHKVYPEEVFAVGLP
jgi:hypothetical protein